MSVLAVQPCECSIAKVHSLAVSISSSFAERDDSRVPSRSGSYSVPISGSSTPLSSNGAEEAIVTHFIAAHQPSQVRLTLDLRTPNTVTHITSLKLWWQQREIEASLSL